jgi:anti-anti-sigma factor
MTVTIGTAASHFVPRYGSPAFECNGAQMRAQCRHLATVVTISGAIDATNVDRVSQYSRRFILADTPIVLDLSGVNSFCAQGAAFLYALDDECRAAGIEWVLVASDAVEHELADEGLLPTTGSVPEALHFFADAIASRRRLLLPLLTKTA